MTLIVSTDTEGLAMPALALPASFRDILDRLAVDDTHRALMTDAYLLGSKLDAANDGALHHHHDRDAAYRMQAAISHRYDRARAALVAYENGVSK